jgi:predicted deacylase
VTVDAAIDTEIATAPPDLTPYRAGNVGIPYVTSLMGAVPGSHVMVVALTHGNEICGAIALDRLFRRRIQPARGKLTLAFANVPAYGRFDPARPRGARFVDEDFNRVWDAETLDGPRRSTDLARARELRPLIDTVDLLLDLHSMTAPSPPLALTGMCDKSVALARQVGMPEIIVRDPGHADGARLRDYGRFGNPAAAATALLIECGQHWRHGTAEFAFDATMRFLAATGVIAPSPMPPAKPQRVVEVTHTVVASGERFAFVRDFHSLEIVPKAATIVARDGDEAIATPYDNCVIVMPSGDVARGQTAVRLGRFRE